MLILSNLKKAILTNHTPKHAIKQTQIVKNHQSLTNSVNIVEKMAIVSHDVLNDKTNNIVKSFLNHDTIWCSS